MRTIAALSWSLPVACLLFGIQSCRREFEPVRWVERPTPAVCQVVEQPIAVTPVACPEPTPDPEPTPQPTCIKVPQRNRELEQLLAAGARQLVLLLEVCDYAVTEIKEAMPLLDPPKYQTVSTKLPPVVTEDRTPPQKPDRPPIVTTSRDDDNAPPKKVQIVQLEQQPEPGNVKLDNSTNEVRTIEINGQAYKIPAKSQKLVAVPAGDFTCRVVDFDEAAKTRKVGPGEVYEIQLIPAGGVQQAQMPMPKVQTPRPTTPTYIYPNYSYPTYYYYGPPIYYGGFGGCSR